MPKRKSIFTSGKWKEEGHDWGSATKIFFDTLDPLAIEKKGTDTLGYYNRGYNLLWVNTALEPDSGYKKTTGDYAENTHPGTISHELSHRQLEHGDETAYLVKELEVRLYQELQDFYQDKGDSFLSHFKDELAIQLQEDPKEAYIVRDAAYEAIKNIDKRKLLSKSKKLKYFKAIYEEYNIARSSNA
jgi:hypothetical protein